MPKNWQAREKKIQRRKHGMRVDGRSVFVLQQVTRDKARKAQLEIKAETLNASAYSKTIFGEDE